MTSAIATREPTISAWQVGLLQAIGAPQTPDNLRALQLWANSEGVAADRNNPLAITDPHNQYPHAGVVASNGGNPVYAFPDPAVAVEATASFLQHGYQNVIAAFQQNAGLPAIYMAINESSWCKGCQNGKYPIQLANAVGGSGTPTPTSPSGTPAASGSSQDSSNPCILSLPSLGPVGGGCIFHESQGRAILGSLLCAAGITVAGLGVTLLVAKSFGAVGGIAGQAAMIAGKPANAVASRFRPSGTPITPDERTAQRKRASSWFRERPYTDEERAEWRANPFPD